MRYVMNEETGRYVQDQTPEPARLRVVPDPLQHKAVHEPDDLEWMAQAACLGMDPALFFPERSASGTAFNAKAVCRECPVVDDCLAYALATDAMHGVWGGTTERDRRRMRVATRRLSAPVVRGKTAGALSGLVESTASPLSSAASTAPPAASPRSASTSPLSSSP